MNADDMGSKTSLPEALHFNFNASPSGEVDLVFPINDDILPVLLQGAPLPPPSKQQETQWLIDKYLTLHLESTPEFLSKAGHSWQPQVINPTLWTGGSDPATAIEPVLPQEYANNTDRDTIPIADTNDNRDIEQEHVKYGKRSKIGFQEVELNAATTTASGGVLLSQRFSRHGQKTTAPRQNSRDFIRGKTGSVPFMPGGEAWNSVGNPLTAAATAEAATGLWLEELAAGTRGGLLLPRVNVPGLGGVGAFGAWAVDNTNCDNSTKSPGIEEIELNLQAVNLVDDELAGNSLPPSLTTTTANVAVNNNNNRSVDKESARKQAIQNLFTDVWLLEDEEDDEEKEELLDEEDVIEDGSAEKQTVSTTMTTTMQEASKMSLPGSGGGTKTSVAAIDALVDLPSFDALPGGVPNALSLDTNITRTAEVDVDVDAALTAISSIPHAKAWNAQGSTSSKSSLKDKAASSSVSISTSTVLKRKRKESDWAVKGSIRNMDVEFENLRPSMAKTYPFELDIFQKEAILHMEKGHSVFVAAHTSAGKTVAAEYAFALASKHCTRAVYTSPIKTISNQKFRDFSGQFEVGLLTGDVSIKPESPCLIMTTEILRSMLYKGADVVRDIEWVIFDEVHYVNDAERGVVWEEVIIMLPDHVGLVLLSATVPNVMEFADWVGRTKKKVVYVTGTLKRPVPLEHSLYYGGQLYTIARGDAIDPKGFQQARLAHAKKTNAPQTKSEAKAQLPTGRGDGGGGGRGGGGRGGQQQQQQQQQRYNHRGSGPSSAQTALRSSMTAPGSNSGGGPQLRSEKSQWSFLIETLRKKDLIPMVVFCFSKKRCDALADCLQSLDLTTATEKSEIHVFCDKALARLKGTDRELPQVLRLREMLKRGLGVHHAGLLPIVKEMVEMLFCRGVIKVLFSTETFAMGVNAPARTVVFQSLRKHDGKQFRTILPGEYTQMAGRAGRRGLDSVGTVIIACWEELPEETDIRRLLTGAATKLESQFRLTYSMILNLLRVEDLTVEDMMKRSFAEFHAQRAQPEVQEALKKGQDALRKLRRRPWPASPLGTSRAAVEEYYELSGAIEQLDIKLQSSIAGSRGAQQALSNGRVVLISNPATGVTEVGVIVDAGTSAGTSGGGKGKKKVGLNLDSFSSSTQTSSSSLNEGSGSGVKKVVLHLHRPSPLDTSGVNVSNSNLPSSTIEQQKQQQQNAVLLPPVLKVAQEEESKEFGGFKAFSKKKDDDDFFLGLKPLGGKSSSAMSSSSSSLGIGCIKKSTKILSLPQQGTVSGTLYKLREVAVTDIPAICKVKIRVDADEIVSGDTMCTAAAVHALLKVQEQAAAEGGDPPLMDPITDLKLNSLELVGDVRERSRLAALRAALPCHHDPALPEMLAMVRSEGLLAARMTSLAKSTGDESLQQLPEFHNRVKVLQQMGYLDEERIVTMKGRVACEINSGDELVATELIFGGVLADLSPEEAVALLSALVFQEKTQVEPALSPNLQLARDQTVALAYNAGVIQRQHGLDILPEEFVATTLKFGLAEVVYEWARGTPFKEICELTDVMEGSIVRAMVRLDESCREFGDAARVMGNTALFKQMQEASAAIKRDVIFAASLYVA